MKTRTHLVLAVLLCVVGLADSAYLTYDHFAHYAVADYAGGLCGVEGGCELARTSSLSEVPMPGDNPGLPISLIGFAFYAAYLLITAAFARCADDEGRRPKARSLVSLGLLLTGGALAYSLLLGSWSLSKGSLCKFCSILYAVNAGLFTLNVLAARRDSDKSGSFFSSLGRSVRLPVTIVMALVFVTVNAVGYIVYRGALFSAADARAAELAGAGAVAPAAELIATRAAIGPAAARVQIIEFADFQCPHCQSAFTHLTELAETFPNDIRVTFLNFPLDQACNSMIDSSFHDRACHLARVAECAWRQDRFVDAARVIYQQQRLTDDAGVLTAVKGLGLDSAALDTCLADPTSLEAVVADVKLGIGAGIRGTPTIYLNGKQLQGPLSHDDVKKLLETPTQATP